MPVTSSWPGRPCTLSQAKTTVSPGVTLVGSVGSDHVTNGPRAPRSLIGTASVEPWKVGMEGGSALAGTAGRIKGHDFPP